MKSNYKADFGVTELQEFTFCVCYYIIVARQAGEFYCKLQVKMTVSKSSSKRFTQSTSWDCWVFQMRNNEHHEMTGHLLTLYILHNSKCLRRTYINT